MSTDDSAGRIVNNLVIILTVYVSIFSSLYIAIVGGIASIKTEMSELIEDPSNLLEFEVFSEELLSGLYSLILKSAGILTLCIVVGMLILEVLQKFLHKSNMWDLLYYEEMTKLLKIEEESRTVKTAEISKNKKKLSKNKAKKNKEK